MTYKRKLSGRRSNWRTLNNIKSRLKEQLKKELVQKFRKKLDVELKGICNEALNLIEKHLLPKAPNASTKVYYLKMNSDYYRYLAETLVDKAKKKIPA
jgi:14-3-3 protein beta/theta/zeta